MSRERLLIIYSLLVGAGGWLWLLFTPGPPVAAATLLLFGALAVAVDTLGFRVPPADAYSLSGLVLLTAALALSPSAGALLAALTGAISGLLLPILYGRPLSFYSLVARPFLRGGVRAAGVLLGGLCAGLAGAAADPLGLLAFSIPAYILAVHLGRIGREYIQGGPSGVSTWWRSSWRLALGAELAPLPLALLGAAIFRELGGPYFFMAGLALIAAAAAVRRASFNLQSQRRSVRELALLNEVSRAIIRSEHDVAALAELIYREASKIVDTSSFHLGLFSGDTYTLMVRVQDRVRLPALSVDLSDGDGLIGWIRQTGRALLVDDFAREMSRLPARPRYQSERPPRSGIYVPLIDGEQVIGSISVQSYQPGSFSANDLRLLSLIADQAAVAIARAQAFNQARQRATQLQLIRQVSEQITAILDMERLLPSVVQGIREHFGYHPVAIFTIERGDDRIRFRASTASGMPLEQAQGMPLLIGQGIVGAAAAAREPLLVGDVRQDPRYIRDSRHTRSELAVPLRIGDDVIGVLDVQSDEVDDFDADDMFVLRTLADQIAVAIDSANLYKEQQEEAWTLNALLQVAENIGQAGSVDELLATAVRLPPLLLGCRRSYLLVWDWERRQFSLGAAYGLGQARPPALGQPMSPEHSRLLARLQALADDRDAPRLLLIPAADPLSDEWPALSGAPAGGSLVAMPLLSRISLLGALILEFEAPALRLSPRQTNLCGSAAAQVAAALESLLLAREADEAARLEQELRVAREIQTALLPASPPGLPGWQIDAAWRSARLVGGDFFDFWPLHRSAEGLGRELGGPEPRTAPPNIGFVIADVSDKGVPAAMFMAMSRSLVRAAALDGSAPATAMERANRWITRDSESGMFVTLFYAVLDPASGRLHYTSAGHNPPLLYRAASGQIEELRTPGIALGVLEEIRLGQAETVIQPGDLLVCYTDGVTETIDDSNDAFGVERLQELVRRHHSDPAEAVVERIIAAVTEHSRGRPAFDDVTLVVVRRL